MNRARPIGLAPDATELAAGQDERKYSTGNPVVRNLLGRFITTLAERVEGEPGRPALDMGVGEGLALERLRVDDTVVGVEYRADKLAAATARLPRLIGVRADAGMLPFADNTFRLVICTEVLEHLVRPSDAVSELARVCAGTCIVSVPWEPWFRLGNLGRGKNVRRLGNDPEHVGWYSPRSLRTLLGIHFQQVDVQRCFPWLIARGQVDDPS